MEDIDGIERKIIQYSSSNLSVSAIQNLAVERLRGFVRFGDILLGLRSIKTNGASGAIPNFV